MRNREIIKKNNMLKLIKLLEEEIDFTTKELSSFLGVSDRTIYNYMREFQKLGLDIKSFNRKFYILESRKNLDKVKKDLGGNIDIILYSKKSSLDVDKSSIEYIKELFIKISFEKRTKREAISYVKRNSLASIYDIYTVYDELRKEYINKRVG